MKKILIIEDDVKAGEIYTQALQRAGFSCSVVTSADEGVTEIKNNHPDLVLLDIMLPGGKNGFDVLEHLKRDDKTKDIPVIVLTNLDTEKKVAMQIGANDYFVKANTTLEQIVNQAKSHFKII